MNKVDFFSNLVDYSHAKGFTFFASDKALDEPKLKKGITEADFT